MMPDAGAMKTEAEWRLPSIREGEVAIASLPGRSFPPAPGRHYGIDCKSHAFRVLRSKVTSQIIVRVKHGGGEEDFLVSDYLVPDFQKMGEEDAYRFCYVLQDAVYKARRAAEEETAERYRRAFVEGRLKKRKLPNQSRVNVWIEPARVKEDLAVQDVAA